MIFPKSFENPKIIHIFARLLDRGAPLWRKSLRSGTVNNV